MAITQEGAQPMNNEQKNPAQEIEVLKRMILSLRNDAANAMTAASEFKARYEIAAEENAELKKQLAAAQKKKETAAGPALAAN